MGSNSPHAEALRRVIGAIEGMREHATSVDERTTLESLLEMATAEQTDANMIAEAQRNPVIVERNTREQYVISKALPRHLHEYQPYSDEELAEGARRLGMYGRTGS
jgi:hypothetical protein